MPLFFFPELLHMFVRPNYPVPAIFLGIIQHRIRHLQVKVIGAVFFRNNGNTPNTDRNPLSYRWIVGNMEILYRLPDFFHILKDRPKKEL